MKQVLNHQKFYLLCEWVKELASKNKPIISTYVRLSEQATKELKFQVSPGAVKNAIESTDVSFVSSEKRAANFQSDRIVRLSSVLMDAIEQLESKIGETLVSAETKSEIRLLVQRKGKKQEA